MPTHVMPGLTGGSGICTLRFVFSEGLEAKARAGIPLAFRSGRIAGDFAAFYLNDKALGTLGTIDPYLPGNERELVASLPATSLRSDGPNRLHAVLRLTSNFNTGGLSGPNLEAGQADGVFARYRREVNQAFVLATLYFAVALFHLFLGLRRPREVYNLYFGLFTLGYGSFYLANSACADTVFGEHFYARLMVDRSALPFMLMLLPFVTFLFRGRHSKVGLALVAFNLLLLAFFLVAPFWTRQNQELVFELSAIVSCALAFWEIIRNCWRRNIDAILLVVGIFTAIGGLVNDILAYEGLVATPPLSQYTLMGFILGMAGILANRFVRVHNQLEVLNVDLENKVEKRTAQLSEALDETRRVNEELRGTRDELWGEMQLAKKIQTALLPLSPTIPGFELEVHCTPADDVGGDYFDVIRAAGKNWLVIGDVSGHGVPAGLVMMMVQTAMHTALKQKPDLPPSGLLTTINSIIANNLSLMGEDKHVSITVAELGEQGRLRFAGLHLDLLIYRAQKKEVEAIPTHGIWLGVLDDIEGMLPDACENLEPGDTLLFHTDGLTEARRPVASAGVDQAEPAISLRSGQDGGIREARMYGDARLQKLLQTCGELPPKELKTRLLDSLEGFVRTDDVTFMILRRQDP